jgi:flavodoxin
MKALVIYYSMEGNTRLTAETIAEAAGADLLELKPERESGSRGLSRYLWGGKAAMMREKPALLPLEVDPDRYNMFFIGTPVWAWTLAPPLNSFLSCRDFSGKQVALFCCHGGGPGRIFRRMREAIPGAVFLGELGLRDPAKHDTEAQLALAGKWALEMRDGLR